MLQKRIFAATIMISLLALGMWLDLRVLHDSLALHFIFLLGAFFSFREFWPLCRATGHQTFSVWGTFSGCGLVAVHYWAMHLETFPGTRESAQHGANLLNGALATAILGAFLLTARRNKFEDSLGGVAVTSLGLLYIFFLPSFVLKLRHLHPDGSLGGPTEYWNVFGHKMVVATIVLAKGCDAWAYIGGKLLGRHKAFPRLSPGKTIEGLAAGLVGTLLTSLLLRWEVIGILSDFSAVSACLLGVCIGIAGTMGDLVESLLKRSAGAKDAGHVIPGYGGAMDVVDSLMVAGPVAYFLVPVILRFQ